MKNANSFPSNVNLALACFCALTAIQSASGQSHRLPPRPSVAPLIGTRYANDADGDRIDDQLLARAQRSQAKPDELVSVELIFKEPVTQRQIDTFIALGGE